MSPAETSVNIIVYIWTATGRRTPSHSDTYKSVPERRQYVPISKRNFPQATVVVW